MEKLLYLTTSLLAVSLSQLPAVSDTSLKNWWDGKRGTGDWFGARPALEDRGINLTGRWTGTFNGVAAGGLDQRGAFDQSLHFDLKVDFATLWRVLRPRSACATVTG
jgi:carbohydrate-selective porin OprB